MFIFLIIDEKDWIMDNQLTLKANMALRLSQLKLHPTPLIEDETKLVEYTKLLLSRVTAFEPIVSALQNVMRNSTTGIYKGAIPS